MAVHKPSHLVPRLRFPEFAGQPLHDVRLRDMTEESTTRNGSGLSSETVMGVKKEDGIVPMEERLVAADISRYKLVRNNWFAYNPMRLNIGSIARWQGESDVLVSPDYVVFRCLERSMPTTLLPAYFDLFRGSGRWDAFVREAGDGGVRIRIYYRDIAQLQLTLPDVDEQQKIADCLGSLDDLIAAESRKLEALRQHKQGLMQKLFPQPGETVPQLRFPEFRSAPEWENKTLGDVSDIFNGGTPRTDVAEYWDGEIQWLTPKDMEQMHGREISSTPRTISQSGLDGSSASLVPERSVILSTRAPIGHLAINTVPMAFNQGCRGFIPGDYVDHLFLYYILSANSDLLQTLGAGSTFKELSSSSLKELSIPLPRLPEQQHISGCLGSLDDLMAAQDRKLDALLQYKRGLVQQLFPSLDGH